MVKHIDLTRQQKLGIDIDRSIGMIAGAGSGKTRVLTERFIEILERCRSDGFSAEKALKSPVAITFTRKASSEMAGRIAERCEELATEVGGNGDFWHEVAMRMSEASIGTIDSFCGGIVRRYPLASGLDPTSMMEPIGKDFIETIAEEFCRSVTQNEGELTDFARRLAELAGWSNIPKALATAFGKRGLTGEALSRTPRDGSAIIERWRAAIDGLGGMWNLAVRREVSERIEHVVEIASAADPTDKLAIQILQLSENPPDPGDPASFLIAAEILTRKSGDARRFSGSGNKKKWTEADLETARAELNKIAAVLAGVKAFIPVETNDFDINDAEATALFAMLYRPFARFASERLIESGTLDFPDMIIGTHDIVEDPNLAEDIGEGIGAILVDEFQDTDPLQWEIVSRLAEFSTGKLFWVGDPKQSIYRFRGADVSNVSKGKGWVESRDGAIAGLSCNFRTTESVLRFANILGEMLFTEDSPMDFDFLASPQSLEFGRAVPEGFDGGVEILLPGEEEEEAEMIARRIWTSVNGDADGAGRLRVEDCGTVREARWGDIAVLFPSRSGILELLQRALLARDIPHLEIGGQGFYSTNEIRCCADLLLYAADRRDGLALMGLLRGPIFALPDTSIYAASIAGDGDIRKGIDMIAKEGVYARGGNSLSSDEINLVAKSAKLLAEIEADAISIPPSELLSGTILKSGAWTTFRALVNGKQRIANVEKFIEICAGFDEKGLSPLADFLREKKRGNTSEREASVEHEGTDAVKLMTVHQSKGLEFPVVIAANLAKKPGGNRGEIFKWDPVFGPLLTARRANGTEKGAAYNAVSALESSRDDAERRRLLYVAATRARDHLILSTAKWGAGYTKYIASVIPLDDLPDGCGDMQVRLRRGINSIEMPPPEQLKNIPPIFEIIRSRDLPLSKPPADSMPVPGSGVRFIRATDLAKIGKRPRKALIERIADSEQISGGRGAKWGTIVHAFLQAMPTPIPQSSSLKRIAEKALIIGQSSTSNDIKLMLRLADNDLVRGLFADSEIDYREKRIILRRGELLITGVIDRLWKDSHGWHLIDYKSDAVVGEEREKRLRHYAPQLALYRLAVSQALEIPECSIETSILFTHKIPELLPIPEIDLDATLSAIEAQ